MTKLYWKDWKGSMIVILLCFLTTQAMAQSRTITGKVVSEDDGSGLPGASILEKGTSNGTVSDTDGNYSITVSENATLIITFIGYTSKEFVLNTQNVVNVSLPVDVATLNEVVIIGYGTVKKSDATGSLAIVDSKAFNKGVVNSPQELLLGKTAGVSITSNSGAPGNTSTIRIRGGASLGASNDPLIIIDGVPISNNNLGGSPNILSTINPNDIETFTVLKDASATAIYGLRASNGVIIITTKRGSKDFKINYTTTGTAFTAPRRVEVFNATEYRALIEERFKDNPTAIALLGYQTDNSGKRADANTDWQKEIYNDVAFGQDHNLGFSGTALKTPFRVSVGYNNTDGILKTYNFKRTTASISLDPSLLNDRLKININVKGMLNDNNFADQSAIGDAISYDPTKPVFNGNTRWRGYTSWTGSDINGTANTLAAGNPVAKLDLTDNTSTVKRSIGNIKFDYEIPFLKQLRATLNLGYDYTDTEGHDNVKDSTQWINITGGGRKKPYSSSAKNQLLDFYLNYNRDIKSIDSKLELLGGYSWSHFYTSVNDSIMNAAGENVQEIHNEPSEYYLLSFFGRLNYTFKDKYILTATLRNDRTSRFNKDVRSGYFPSLALGWKIKSESFLKDSRIISDLKLRVGYGSTGQQDIVNNNYPYISSYTRSDQSSRYRLGNTYYNTLRPDVFNYNIKWETTQTVNAALDYGFFQNRITGSLDLYNRKSVDLISYVPPSKGTNFGSEVISNVGSITNKGIELNINAEVISKTDLQWIVGYNITYNKNTVTKLTLNDDPDYFVPVGSIGCTTCGYIQAQKLGNPRQAFNVYQQVYGEDGNPLQDIYVDRNGDNKIDENDKYSYKQPDPRILMGINSRMNYKSWDFSFSGRANFGNYVYNNVASNSTYDALYNVSALSNVNKQVLKTEFYQATKERFSDYYVENASFFRMDNVNIGYTFENLYNEKLDIRIGAGVQNVFVITKYTGIDPEISGGIDNNFFPRTRSFFLNLNCQF